ncbi:GDSL-type esterase/lipase family protein [Streptomyces sp. B6B3]|uniref:GDSL-type esterase/lipase family protein n=1 Tax=Streptomyces sp. B6B3 TaxID=3153570 RepID=UPI00325D5151
MLVSRRPVALALASAALLLAGCSSSDDSGAAGDADVAAAEAGDEERRPAPPATRVWDTSPSSVAAIGDSITRGFDTCSLLTDCPEASWATGTDAAVDSLAMQLLAGEGGGDITDRSWNLAESGATVADLPDQARQAAGHQPQLVTVLIGANDACAADLASMTDVADFEADFSDALRALRAESPDTQVYVSSVPDLMRLWREGSESMMARTVWQMANICPSMLSDPNDETDDATTRREAVRERVQEYNEVLERVCATDELCRYDGGAVFDYEFTTDHLSQWDWFHPGESGQRQLAALAYEQVAADQVR